MATLTIDGNQYEAKANFKFERVAEKKYKSEKGEITGLEQIYQDLMAYKPSALVAFWDCATAHLAKKQPSVEKIEDALAEIIENDDEEEIQQLFKDAFQVIDNSGFFRLQLKEFWKNLDLIDKLEDDEKEKEKAQLGKEMYLEKRRELNPSIINKSSKTQQDS